MFIYKIFIPLVLLIGILYINSKSVNASNMTFNNNPYQIENGQALHQKVRSLLIVTSIDPIESEYFLAQTKKINYLAKVIQSHWPIIIDLVNVSDYEAGSINNYDALYFIEEYNETIPTKLKIDILNSKSQEIILSGFAADELASSILSLPLPTRSNDFVADTLSYKNVDFETSDFTYLGNLLLPENQDGVETLITRGEEILAIDIDNRFLILPFLTPSYFVTNDYSLIFLDIMHRALGHHESNKKALLRLEDVDPKTYGNTRKLTGVYNYLKQNEIPFHIALIARYVDPTRGIDVEITDKFFFIKLIKTIVQEGWGTIVQHGYTHQTGSGISGMDFEFWDGDNNRPLSHDSEKFVFDRIASVQELMNKNGLPVPDIWETPHYALSEIDNQVINSAYPLRYEHIPSVGSLPFVAQIDNTIYIPENLGYVFDANDIPKMEKLIEQISVFEDPVASFFWHPWRNRSELIYLTGILRSNGFEFVSAYDLVDSNKSKTFTALTAFKNDDKVLIKYKITEAWVIICFALFSYGSYLYLKNTYLINKYLKKLETFKPTLSQLNKIAKKTNKKMPTIAIFVPARNEGYVIRNTLQSLLKLNYPNDLLKIFIIVDERELDDNVEILTKDVVMALAKKYNSKYKQTLIHCIQVPKWYGGKFGNKKRLYQKSSKGRALNYALQKLYDTKRWKKIDLIGVLDADGRLNKNVLKEVSLKRLTQNSLLLQGPVFQVSNFKKVSIIGITAGLELAIHHMSVLTHNLLSRKKHPQFLAGTNYFIDTKLIIDLGGWDEKALVEDAELALRAYVQKGITADWLSSPEIEQTPPTFAVYKKQRERWVMGHLNLIGIIKKSNLSRRDKARFLREIYMLFFRIFIDLGIPILGWALMLAGILMDLGYMLRMFSLFLMLMSIFIWDFYGRMYRILYKSKYIENGYRHHRIHQIFQSIKLILYMPVFIVAQSIPRLMGGYKYIFNLNTGIWYKTERTKE